MFDRIRELREYEDYSMNEVAKKLCVSKGTYSMWEYGNDVIPHRRLIKLANIYHVKLDYLLNLTDKKTNNILYDNVDLKVIGKNLVDIRKQLNLTQLQLANNIHTSKGSISRYENGKVLITTLILYELCKKYHLSADKIIFNKE